MAPENTQRILSSKVAGGVTGESVLFSFNEKGRGEVMQQAPFVWVESLEEKIVDTIQR